MLVDIHCHLTHKLFENDLNDVIKRNIFKGVKAIICSGVNPTDNLKVLEICAKYDIVKASLGIYPIDALGLGPDETGIVRYPGKINLDSQFEFFLKNKDKIVSIGEVGLDYKMDLKYHAEQKENFSRIIDFCEKFKKPIVIHSRKAEVDVIDMLLSSKLKKVVLHCFEGRKHIVKKAIDSGYSFSIPCSIVKLQHFQLIVDACPTQQLLTETDAPWLGPVPGARNEPFNVIETVRKIAEIKRITSEEAENLIFMNYQRMFL